MKERFHWCAIRLMDPRCTQVEHAGRFQVELFEHHETIVRRFSRRQSIKRRGENMGDSDMTDKHLDELHETMQQMAKNPPQVKGPLAPPTPWPPAPRHLPPAED